MQKTIKIILLLGLLFNLVQQAESQQKKRQTKNSQSKTVQTKNLTAEQIAKKYLPSVVLIVCDDGKGNYSQGSGFFIRQGMILTNYHVIEDMVRGIVKTVSGDNKVNEWWIEKILYADSKNDLALLFINGTDKTKTPVLNLSTTDKINIGESIFVLSNPKGLTGTISQGIVSSGIRKIKDIELLQIDAPISAGSSGGAVLNSRGEVIGIATASLSSGQNLNFAVPSSQIKSFIKDQDARFVTFPYRRSAEIPNAWLKEQILLKQGLGNGIGSGSGLGQGNQTTKPKEESKLSYEEISEKIANIIQNTPIKIGDQRQQGSINFSQCDIEYIFNIYNFDGFYLDFKDSYKSNLKFLKVAEPGGIINMVLLDFQRNLIVKRVYENGKERYSVDTYMRIQLDDKSKVSEIVFLFNELKNFCKQDDTSTVTDKQTLKLTTDWLTNKLEGTEHRYEGKLSSYDLVRFSQNELTLVSTLRGEKFKSISTYKVKLSSLVQVEIYETINGQWAVMLGFDDYFNVNKETINNGVRNEETIKKEEFAVVLNSYEDARKVAVAFTRLMELCSESTE